MKRLFIFVIIVLITIVGCTRTPSGPARIEKRIPVQHVEAICETEFLQKAYIYNNTFYAFIDTGYKRFTVSDKCGPLFFYMEEQCAIPGYRLIVFERDPIDTITIECYYL